MSLGIFIIQLGIGLTMFIFGSHQLMRPGQWIGYIPDWVSTYSPLSKENMMVIHAVGNIIFALLLASTLAPLVATWIAFVWMLTILPFSFRKWDIGMRDLSIALSLLGVIVMLTK